MRKTLLGLCAGLMMVASSAQAQDIVKVNFAPPAQNPLQKLMTPKKMTPIQPRSAWICYTPYGSCWVSFLGLCSCCNAFGCFGGST